MPFQRIQTRRGLSLENTGEKTHIPGHQCRSRGRSMGRMRQRD